MFDTYLALPIAYVMLRVLILLNRLSGVAIFALLIVTLVAEDWTMRALGIAPQSWIIPNLAGLRIVAALGILGAVFNDMLLRRLLAIVATVRMGDPFIAANAYRLQIIAWILLGLQLLSLAIGGLGKAMSTPEHPVHLDAGFSPAGWLAVFLAFVLARIFAEGTLMREDLRDTI